MSRNEEFDVGLIGGSIEKRLEHSRVPPLELDGVLAPFRRPRDAEALDAFVAGDGELHIEIGFGRPHHLCDLAGGRPDIRLLGIEIRRRWVRAAAKRAHREGTSNLRVIEGDARPIIARFVQPRSVAAYYILFPDPWWKKRHHKRRIFRPDFITKLAATLALDGHLVVKTDVPAYAEMVDEELDAAGWTVLGVGAEDPILGSLPKSHREKKCGELGIPVHMMRLSPPA